jgi:hypothetical protein
MTDMTRTQDNQSTIVWTRRVYYTSDTSRYISTYLRLKQPGPDPGAKKYSNMVEDRQRIGCERCSAQVSGIYTWILFRAVVITTGI